MPKIINMWRIFAFYLAVYICCMPDLSAQTIDSLKYELNKGTNTTATINEIGTFYYRNLRDSSFIYIQKSINSEFGLSPHAGSIYLSAGEVFMNKQKYEIAYLCINEANKNFLDSEDKNGIAICKVKHAHIYLKFYDFDKAINNLLDANEIFEEVDLEAEQSKVLIKLGSIFFQLGQFKNAFEYFTSASKIAESLNDPALIADSFFHLAKTHERTLQFEEAESLFNQCLSVYLKTRNNYGVAHTYFELAELYFKMDQFNEAKTFYEKSVKTYESIEDIEGAARSYLSLAKYYLSIDEREKAIYYLNESLFAAEYTDIKELLIDIYKNLSLYYEKENIFDQAIFYYKSYSNLKDSLSPEKQAYRLANIRASFENQQQLETILKLEADSFYKDEAIKKQRYLLITISFAGLILIILAIIILVQSRTRKKVNKELTQKNESLKKAENELKKINAELNISEKRLKEIVQNMPVLVTASDSDGSILFWNKACEMVTGYSANDVIENKELSKEIVLSAKKIQEIDFKRENAKFQATEYEIETRTGDKRHIAWTSMSEIFPVEGWNNWYVGIDVTERNLFSKSLERETAILNSILNSIPHPIFYKDKDSRYQKANPGFYKLYNLSDESLIGKSDWDLFPENYAEYFNYTDSIVLQDRVPFQELRWSGQHEEDGLLFDTIKTPLYNSNNELIGVVGISFDMTERYFFEQELKNQKEKAEEADRLKSAFLANMSHEIRSPMNAIIGFTNLISDTIEKDSEIQTFLEYIRQSGENLLQLLDDIIDIAKLEAGQLKMRKESFDLNEMLENLKMAFNSNALRKKKEHIELRLTIPDDSEKPVIHSDSLRIKQVLINFLSNAFKFTDEGFIEFGYEKLPSSEILFFTRDTGIGIADSYKEIIFDRFGQVKETYTRNTSGTGLGLAICKSIVELMGGQIWLDSIENKGSTFYFKIPVEYSTESVKIQKEITYEEKRYDWTGKKILVVEDDDMNYKVLKSVLEKTNIQISRAIDGVQAVEQSLSDSDINLIMMDIQLPVMNGYDATKKIRESSKVPIIALTAYSMPGEKEKSLNAGCNAYLTKPFNRHELLHIISKLMA